MTSAIHGSEFVTDTMGLVLRLEGRRLGSGARAAYEAVEAGTATLFVPGMVFAEMLYLSRKGRISATVELAASYLARFPSCREAPLDLAVVRCAAEIDDIPELHDLLIAATARRLSASLITNDPAIIASPFVRTIW